MSEIIEDIKKSKELIEAVWKDQKLFETNYSQVEVILRDLLVNEPENVRVITNLGAILSDTGRHSEALEILRIGESLGSIDKNLYVNIATAMMNLNNERQNAKDFFKRAGGLKPDSLTIEAYFEPHGH